MTDVDIDIESEEGAQQKADQAQSNAESHADSEIENHRSTETHDTAQPPQPHDNEAHDRDFVDEGEAAAAAPVQSVNGEVGDVESVSDHDQLSNVQPGQHNTPKVALESVLWAERINDSTEYTGSEYSLLNNYGEITNTTAVTVRVVAEYLQHDDFQAYYGIEIGGVEVAEINLTSTGGSYVEKTYSEYLTVQPGDELEIYGNNSGTGVRNMVVEVNDTYL